MHKDIEKKTKKKQKKIKTKKNKKKIKNRKKRKKKERRRVLSVSLWTCTVKHQVMKV